MLILLRKDTSNYPPFLNFLLNKIKKNQNSDKIIRELYTNYFYLSSFVSFRIDFYN